MIVFYHLRLFTLLKYHAVRECGQINIKMVSIFKLKIFIAFKKSQSCQSEENVDLSSSYMKIRNRLLVDTQSEMGLCF